MPSRELKPRRTFFYGHAPVLHAPGDWRCKCGERLRSWRFEGDHRIEMTGRDGARQAMELHRAVLWVRWNSQ